MFHTPVDAETDSNGTPPPVHWKPLAIREILASFSKSCYGLLEGTHCVPGMSNCDPVHETGPSILWLFIVLASNTVSGWMIPRVPITNNKGEQR